MKKSKFISVCLLTISLAMATGCAKDTPVVESETVTEQETMALMDYIENTDKIAIIVDSKDINLKELIQNLVGENVEVLSVDDSGFDVKKAGKYTVKVCFSEVSEQNAEMISGFPKKDTTEDVKSDTLEYEISIEVIEEDKINTYLSNDYVVVTDKGIVIMDYLGKETESETKDETKETEKEVEETKGGSDRSSSNTKPQSAGTSGSSGSNAGASSNTNTQTTPPVSSNTDNKNQASTSGNSSGNSTGNTSNSSPSNSGSSSGASKPTHTHNWVEQFKTVHHEAEGRYEDVLVQEAYDETVTEEVYDPWECCNYCGADITADIDTHIKNHMMNGVGGRWHTEYYKTVTRTVHHDAVYESRWVETSPAYDEKVSDGYVCSGCGARR